MKHPTDEEIEKEAIRLYEIAYGKDDKDSVWAPGYAATVAKWARDQQPNEDIEKLKAKAFALDNLWFPIVDYAQSHKIEGLKPGDGISDFVLKLLKEITI